VHPWCIAQWDITQLILRLNAEKKDRFTPQTEFDDRLKSQNRIFANNRNNKDFPLK